MTAYYNEHDENAAAWLRELIKEGHIADGIVDTRSIVAVEAADLRDFDQCHFFAGIGVWSYALRLSGWADDRPVWTGSCPCQPFSAAGKREGFADERHLWPAFHRLIAECRPPTVLGEQVASKDGLAWLDLVQADLEGTGYASGAVDTCAAGVGAPHIRQRLYWVAHAVGFEREREQDFGPTKLCGANVSQTERRDRPGDIRAISGGLADASSLQPEQFAGKRAGSPEAEGGRASGEPAGRGDASRMVDDDARREGHGLQPILGSGEGRTLAGDRPLASSSTGGVEHAAQQQQHGRRDGGPSGRDEYSDAGAAGGLADADEGQCRRFADGEGRERHGSEARRQQGNGEPQSSGVDDRPGPVNGHWRAADWLYCRDGCWRPVEPGSFPLVAGAAARVGRLRGYGNALNAQTAQAFIEAVM